MRRWMIIFGGVIAAVLLANDAMAQQGQGRQGPPGGQQGQPRMRMPIIAAIDADRDGVISAEEIANAPAALKTLDRNKDGQLTRDELRPQFPGRGRQGGPGAQGGARRGQGGAGRGRQGGGAAQGQDRPAPGQNFVNRLMSMDKNGDGKLTKDELPERLQFLLALGKDDSINREEAQKLAQLFGRMRAGGLQRGAARGADRAGDRRRPGAERGKKQGDSPDRPRRPRRPADDEGEEL